MCLIQDRPLLNLLKFIASYFDHILLLQVESHTNGLLVFDTETTYYRFGLYFELNFIYSQCDWIYPDFLLLLFLHISFAVAYSIEIISTQLLHIVCHHIENVIFLISFFYLLQCFFI